MSSKKNVFDLTGTADADNNNNDDEGPVMGSATSLRIPVRAPFYQALNDGPYPRHMSYSAATKQPSSVDTITPDSAPQKAFAEDLIGEVRKIRNAQRLTAVFTFVVAVCTVLMVVALYQDSQTLDKMAVQGTAIMTTVQSILAEFQSTNVLRTVHEVSNTWTDKYSDTAIRVANTIANSVDVVDDVIGQVIRGNTTALIREGLYEASLFIDTANHVLERFTTVFNISPHALENITAGV